MQALRTAVIDSIPRLLSLLDRATGSPTRGSADRAFWLYRVDKDYPSATFAQVAWPLALLATRDDIVADAALRSCLRRHALDALAWWADIQHEDGSFDEWFAFERSHVATSFTSLAAAETLHTLNNSATHTTGPPSSAEAAVERRVVSALARAASWLARNTDHAIANHQAGALAALASIDALISNSVALSAFETQLEVLSQSQDEEGWLPEYGGADPGYGTVSLALLALAARRRPHATLDRVIERSLEFLRHCVHADGSFGGEYGRRATRYAWLTGFALLSERSAVAQSTLSRLLCGVERGTLPSPHHFDDRYFCFFALPDAVVTLSVLSGRAPRSAQVVEVSEDVALPRAGIMIARRGSLRVIVGAGTGGVVKIWLADAPHALLFDDTGYIGELPDGKRVASWRPRTDVDLREDRVTSRGAFSVWTRQSPVARHPVGFRLFNRTLGRIPAASRAVASLAKRRFTGQLRPAPLHLDRRIELEHDRISIVDRISAGVLPIRLQRVAGFAPIHVPSAPLFLPSFRPALPENGPDLAEHLARSHPLTVTTVIEVVDGAARLRVDASGEMLQDEVVELAALG